MAQNSPVDIGIDLGTTFSVLAVKGQLNTVDEYPRSQYLETCDVTILPTPYGDFTFPSAMWMSADGQTVEFGGRAKQLATEGEAPILFSKRSIGTTSKLKIYDFEFTAREVATKFLAYLKQCAEQALGRPVRRAVITHPAYFNENQIQETREAAIDAGFEMSSREQMLMEPTAAALAYTLEDPRDPLRIMTYDLGGGTFDVTILEREQGVVTMKSFDGDHLLGGYNFDRELVQWILGRLRSSGRKIPFDPESSKDQARWSRLLMLAESVKVRLSNQPVPTMPVPIRDPDCLVDETGNPVQIMTEITRPKYQELIQEHLDRTIECCRQALAAARLEVSQLDTILLVGGSTYGPWVGETVQQAFGIEPQLYRPDLCVAAGAALAAADLPSLHQAGTLTLEVDAPRESVLPTVTIAGVLRDATQNPDWTRYSVSLDSPVAGSIGPISASADGRFAFSNVQLPETGAGQFFVNVVDERGNGQLSHDVTITYSPTTSTRTIEAVLPKAITIKVAGGVQLVAAKGSTLPTQMRTISLRRTHSDDSVEIPAFQEDEEVGAIRIDKIPEDAPAGSPIELQLQVNEQNTLVGSARVLNRQGRVVAECDVSIGFPPIEIPTLEELEAMLKDLDGQRQQQLMLSDDPEQRTMLGGAGAKLVKRGKKLSNELQPDRQELYQTCCELDRLVNPPMEEMDPPRSKFRRMIQECDRIIQSSSDPQIQAYQTERQKIEDDGNLAYDEKNDRLWKNANVSISQLYSRLTSALDSQGGPAGPPPEPDPAWMIKDICRSRIERLRTEYEHKHAMLQPLLNYESKLKPRCAAIEASIDKMEHDVEAVDDDEAPRKAQMVLSRIMKEEKRIRRDITIIEVDAQTS